MTFSCDFEIRCTKRPKTCADYVQISIPFLKNPTSYIFLMIDKLNCSKVEETLLKFTGSEMIKICDTQVFTALSKLKERFIFLKKE